MDLYFWNMDVIVVSVLVNIVSCCQVLGKGKKHYCVAI